MIHYAGILIQHWPAAPEGDTAALLLVLALLLALAAAAWVWENTKP